MHYTETKLKRNDLDKNFKKEYITPNMWHYAKRMDGRY